jgi:hypothetical protein
MKRLKYKILSLAVLTLTLGSCKKFLEPPSTSFLSPGFKITSSKEAQALVNSCYSNLPTRPTRCAPCIISFSFACTAPFQR